MRHHPDVPIFKRRRGPAEADADLPFLTAEQAQHVRALVSGSFAERGLEVTVFGDYVQDSSERQFGLWNVAAACHNDDGGPKAWPLVVGDHVRRIVAAMDAPDPFESMTDEQLLAGTYLRLYEQQSVPQPDQYPHSQFAPGLLEMLALDLPDSVAAMTREVVTRLGGYAALRERGLEQLRAVPIDAHEVLDGPGGGRFHAGLGDSVYTGSLALILPEVAHRLTGRTAGQHGWLLSVPNRHQVVWHHIEDAGVIGALEGMATFARLGLRTAPDRSARTCTGGPARSTTSSRSKTKTARERSAWSRSFKPFSRRSLTRWLVSFTAWRSRPFVIVSGECL